MKGRDVAAFGVAAILASKVLANCDMEDLETAMESGPIGRTASILILIIYTIEWVIMLFPDLPPLARPASAMFGAMICLVVTQTATYFGSSGFNSFCYVDYDTLALLFGLMLIVVMIDDSGILLLIEMSLESKSRWWMATKCCFVCAVLSAIVMNDTICLFFTSPIIEACRKHPDIDSPLPYLLALSSNSNIGSALTTTGNPQNAMIASIEHTITYSNFLISMALPCLAAWLINWITLLVWYRHSFGIFGASNAESSGLLSTTGGDYQRTDDESKARKDTLAALGMYKVFLVFGIFVMVVGFFIGISIPGLCVGFGTTFMSIRAVRYSRAAASRRNVKLTDNISEKYLMQVDYTLLIFFTGLFIMISAVVQTGFPEEFFVAVFNQCFDNPVEDCPLQFAIVIILFSNVISNVPLILLIKPFLAQMEQGKVSRGNWLYISWVCTLAGNFILLGSAANVIVSDQAKKKGFDILTTVNHGKFGIPSTIMCCMVGIPLLQMTMQ